MTAKIVALANQKGGVGKTTTTVNLAAYLAAAGRLVLLIDIDSQANATTSLGLNPRTLPVSLYHVLVDDLPAQAALVLTDQLGLDLLPATTDLAGAEVELAGRPGRERLLQRAVAPLLESYDYLLIDNPPSLGLLTLNGLTAAQGVIIPVQCEYLALEGLSMLLNTVHQVQERLNPPLQIVGVVLTMYDARTRLSQEVVEEVRGFFPQEVFATIVPRNVRLGEAPSHGLPILAYAPDSAGAQAYAALTAEFMARTESPVAPSSQDGQHDLALDTALDTAAEEAADNLNLTHGR